MNNSVQRAVRFALCGGAAVAAAATLPANAADTPIQEVVVTGSRISQPNLTTTSPITQVTAEDVAVQGVAKIEDLVNSLPQAFAAQNATVANGSTGTATVNLRGLGSQRTLVLIDGRRMPYGGVTNSAADLNQIPTAMVERVEVLTGGASAVYGSDAIGGVVNFIMKKDFEGIQIDLQGNVYQHNNDFGGPGQVKLRDVIEGRAATNPSQFALPDDNVTDGEGYQANILMGVGTDDGRGNITAYVSYQDNKQILQRDRDFSACSLGANPTVSFACGGSGTAFPGQFTDFNSNFNGRVGPDGLPNTADDTVADTNPLPSYNLSIDQGTGDFRNFTAALDQYNFGPVNHFLRPDTRYSLGAMGHYEISEHADVYSQLMFTDVRSVAQIAPGGAFFDTATINCDNPFLSTQQATRIGCGALADLAANTIDPSTITPENPTGSPFLADPNIVPLYIGRRNVEGGGRQQDFHNTSFRTLVGVRGSIADGWDYDASVQYSRTTADQLTKNYFAIARLQRAMNVVMVNGVETCQSVVDGSDPLCVPYNVFDPSGVTPEALNYLQAPGLQQGVIDQSVAQLVVTGDLGTIGFKLPTASDSVKFAFGVESRHDKLENVTDDLLTTSGLSGTGGATIGIAGSTNVNDIFTEINVPLVQDKAFAQQLGLELAYRYSDYGDSVSTDTYKIGADWAPVEDIRFRASFQRAVRAANIVELFTAQGFNLFDMDGDPCGFALRNAANAPSEEACEATGVDPSQYQSPVLDSPAGQYNFTQGGNRNLVPEESDTMSYGFVFTPGFAPGLSVSVDYFDIEVTQLVSTYGAENTLNSCYQLNDQVACDRIIRNPENGTLWVGEGNVLDLNTNIGGLETSGVDLNIGYASLQMGNMGSLNLNLTATYLIDLITDLGTPGAEPFDCTGYFVGACVSSLTTAVNPELRTRTRIGWATPWNVDLALTHRYISAVEMYQAPANRIDRKLEAEHYFDIFGSWQALENTTIRMGINNVLDNDPSLNASVGTTGNGNTYPQVYDALGRYVFAGLTVTF
ncbi:outer membrane receptor protein involved in Fe transport [Povalibacter uvarum]|uniref:Outer membrane receptor protein involved in Fe transport n=1 Tax=Povalibacter uvarum TaxID=732238 RepID=A0A841HQS4_9GAMM|nr:TonB-dependent receptor [Povalibacter uvarum]MBB6094580.1 outer membrane receptor protein involved in Fe transport [Povalibacter uvarum]